MNPVLKGDFFKLGKIWWYSLYTRWHSRGILSCLWDRLSSNKGFFKISTHGEHNFGCSKFRGCRFHNLYVLYVWILSRREKIIYCGIQYNSAIQLLLATSSLVDLHTRNIIQMSNDFRGTRPLVNLRSLENVSRRENTVPTPATCKLKIWTEVLWAGDAKPLDWGSPLVVGSAFLYVSMVL